MTKDKLKSKIKKKFRTLSNFARLVNMDRTRLQVFFAKDTKPTKEEFETILNLYTTTEAKETNVIDPEKLKLLFERINEQGGVFAFCRAHPEFNVDPIYKLKNGARKRHSKLVQALFNHFGI